MGSAVRPSLRLIPNPDQLFKALQHSALILTQKKGKSHIIDGTHLRFSWNAKSWYSDDYEEYEAQRVGEVMSIRYANESDEMKTAKTMDDFEEGVGWLSEGAWRRCFEASCGAALRIERR
jgi:hypothetical protein